MPLKDFKIQSPIFLSFFLITCFVTFIALIRFNSDFHATNAIKLKQRGNCKYVIKAIDKANSINFYDIDNTSTPLLWYRGVANFNLKNYKEAFKDFKAAYDVNPNHIHVLNNLATSYEIIGNREKAKEFYNKAININPTFKESRVNLAALFYNEKEYFSALSTILQSKVEVYWKRKEKNDSYDFFLKTIFKAYFDSIKNELNSSQIKKINDFMIFYEKNPMKTEKEIRRVFQQFERNEITFFNFFISEIK